MGDIELFPGISFCGVEKFNRISRQQGLSKIIAKAAIFDQICQVVELSVELENELLQKHRQELDLKTKDEQKNIFKAKAGQKKTSIYPTRLERLKLFRFQLFKDDVELRFLDRKRT